MSQNSPEVPKRLELSKGGRALLRGQGPDLRTKETEGQMLQRVMPGLMGMKRILALNDEAHHCYREKPAGEDDEGASAGRSSRARAIGSRPSICRDQDLLREVMNTVGKPDTLGGSIRCVVSVSMLTEGWDARTVTHILGVCAFGTQLLCEQVIGVGPSITCVEGIIGEGVDLNLDADAVQCRGRHRDPGRTHPRVRTV